MGCKNFVLANIVEKNIFVISKKSGNILTNQWLFAPFYFSPESISVKTGASGAPPVPVSLALCFTELLLTESIKFQQNRILNKKQKKKLMKR